MIQKELPKKEDKRGVLSFLDLAEFNENPVGALFLNEEIELNRISEKFNLNTTDNILLVNLSSPDKIVRSKGLSYTLISQKEIIHHNMSFKGFVVAFPQKGYLGYELKGYQNDFSLEDFTQGKIVLPCLLYTSDAADD